MFHIRDIPVDPPLVLAPMEGVTDLSFRRLVRSIGGCGLTVT
ncbi:MAG TPA: tRNA dihydrouridine synthase DusB, partial [Deltaproteobacteria bacterium]|nr:tRNA dihydrouridine synthase DusB [Deltaproteobacteria bacterium]